MGDPDSPSTFNTTFSALVEPLREAEEQEYVFKVEGVDASVKPLGQVTSLNAAANRIIMRKNKDLVAGHPPATPGNNGAGRVPWT